MRENKGSIGVKILIAVLIILIVAAGVLLAIKLVNDRKSQDVMSNNTNEEEIPVIEIKEPKTFAGTDRPIAVMHDNHIDAVPQYSLNDAYMVYEIIVEGGISRLMALYKGVEVDKIGPVRSSRHYFLDYALENDAIYVHFGWSPQAKSDISKLGVNNINGISESSKSFWRTKDKYAPHNVATSTEKILQIAERKGYRTTSTQKSVLNYVAEDVDLDTEMIAKTVTIPYSDHNTVKYEYDEESKSYIRYSRGKLQKDVTSGETVKVKNIIITKCKNWALKDGSSKGRQTIDNIKTLEGYYITNGKAIEITCEKSSRSSQTIYRDLNGNEIEVSDGNTFVQICPLDSKVVIEPGEKIEGEQTNTQVD